MTDTQSNALVLLKGIYDRAHGDVNKLVRSSDVVNSIGMDKRIGRAAFGYLVERGMLKDSREMAELPAVFITASGVDAIEGAFQHPGRPSRYFPAVITINNIGTITGGVVQQGNTGTTTANNYKGSLVDLSILAQELKQLRLTLVGEAGAADRFAALGQLAQAETAAREGDDGRVATALRNLGPAGQWIADRAVQVGTQVVAAAVKFHLGI